MKFKVLFLSFLFMAVGLCKAQVVKVEASEQMINGISRPGQTLTVQLDPRFVEKAWKDYLSDRAGKVRHKRGFFTVEDAQIDTISLKPLQVFSTISNNALGTNVWWSLEQEDGSVINLLSHPKVFAAAEGFMKKFGVHLYRKDILRQINEAEDVLLATKSEHERVVNQATDLQQAIEKNRIRKQELEAQLVENAEDLKRLEQDIIHNKKQQEASRQRIIDMEKAVEKVRGKLLEIKLWCS